MMKAKAVWIFFVICAALVTGCEKIYFNCRYQLTAREQSVEKGEPVAFNGGAAYLFYADTTHWEVGNYELSAAGKIKSRFSTEQRTWDLRQSFKENNIATFAGVNQKFFLLMVCDTVHKIWAWKPAEADENLDSIITQIYFRSWQYTYPYSEGGWIFNCENPPAKPTEPDPEPGTGTGTGTGESNTEP